MLPNESIPSSGKFGHFLPVLEFKGCFRTAEACSLMPPPERGQFCPQQAPNARTLRLLPNAVGLRTLPRTGMSALRPGGAIKIHSNSSDQTSFHCGAEAGTAKISRSQASKAYRMICRLCALPFILANLVMRLESIHWKPRGVCRRRREQWVAGLSCLE